ncbi:MULTISPECIES: LysE family translocator [Arthrobacter]|uniref:LysE family translocator n=2 Tax=Arthrobacter TaxID=1663 RepID=A0ABU9KRC9_9MICC|nr:LysE family translocator [Arthrobacter sp. YJM1]MDP5228629.1 LysE family translocator [Arthrobacter sp. YJM1]
MTLEQSLLGYAALSVLITILPGTDTALILRYALGQSRKHAYMAGLGMITGAFIWSVAAATGVSALLAVSTIAYDVLRIIGAGYMLWLAFSFWKASFAKTQDATVDTPAGKAAIAPEHLGKTWSKGFLSNILNPKFGMFCLAVIPQFLVPGIAPLAMGLMLSVISNLEAIAWFVVIITAAHFFRRWLDGPRFRKIIDRVTGTALGAFGVVAIVETAKG